MKTKSLTMMLVTMLVFTNNECVSQSFTVDVAKLMQEGDINIQTNSMQDLITHVDIPVWNFNQQTEEYEKNSTIKINDTKLLTIDWVKTVNENNEQIYILKQLLLWNAPAIHTELNLQIPGTIKIYVANAPIHVPVHIGERAFQALNLMNLSLALEFVFSNKFVKFPYNCSALFKGSDTITYMDFSGADTALTINMSSMFENCGALQKLCLDDFDMRNNSDSSNMFNNCPQLVTLKFNDTIIDLQQQILQDNTTNIINLINQNVTFWY